MTLHFGWLHAPRWLAHAPINRAMALVLGVIGISLLFGVLRIVDVAVSGALVAPPAAGAPDLTMVTDPPAAGAPVDASAVDLPKATVEAISL